MSPDSRQLWLRVEEALERPPEDRRAFLEEHLDGDALDKALAVIESAGPAEDWFDRLEHELDAARGVAVRRLEADRAKPPDRIGPYRIAERCGIGGMGEVYRAERCDGAFDQTVAIKVLRSSLSDELSLERFRAERQILARLEHPHIARLIDGGVIDDGRPYLVMEWIEGELLDRYADRMQLSARQRVTLFLDVCEAVEHAHRSLVIHRDLKPSNILVDQDGRIKLLDFGIAKMLGAPEGPEATLSRRSVVAPIPTHTVDGVVPMTPRYAAPEQLRGDPVSTSTDVYGLGVVLYELLTGCSPFVGPDGESHDAHDVLLPSARSELTRDGSCVRPRELRGDLDAVVMAALAAEPAERLESPAALRDDLRRVLSLRPVLARRQTLFRRLDRWARRNPVGLGVGAVATVLLVVVGLQLLTQYRATVRERDKAQAVSSMMVELFRSADPLRNQSGPPTAEEILARGRDQVGRLDDQPQLQASLADQLGEVHRNVGLHDEAVDLHDTALSIRKALGDSSREDVAHSLALQADALRLAGRLEEAESGARESLDVALEVYGSNHLETAKTRSLLGRILLSQRRLEPAFDQLESALSTQEELNSEPDIHLATTLNDLAVAHLLRNEHDAAEPLLRRAIAIRSALLGADDPSITGLENNLAAILSARARFSEAEVIYRRLVPVFDERVGPGHLHSINARRNLGLALLQLGREEEALEHLGRALDLAEAELAQDHPLQVVLVNYVGYAHLEAGHLDEAELTLARGLASARRAFSSADPRLASVENNLGLLDERRGDFVTARRRFQQALETSRKQLSEQHPQVLAIQCNLARTELETGSAETAANLFRSTLESQRVVLASQHPDLAYTLIGLAESEIALGRQEAARSLLSEAAEIRRSILPPGHRLLRSVEERLAEV